MESLSLGPVLNSQNSHRAAQLANKSRLPASRFPFLRINASQLPLVISCCIQRSWLTSDCIVPAERPLRKSRGLIFCSHCVFSFQSSSRWSNFSGHYLLLIVVSGQETQAPLGARGACQKQGTGRVTASLCGFSAS